jgi:DNA excision repair protein ERCC-4
LLVTVYVANLVLIIAPEGNVASQIKAIIDKQQNCSGYSCEGSKSILYRQLQNYYAWKANIPLQSKPQATISKNTPASKRRRVRTTVNMQSSNSEPSESAAKDELLASHCRTFLEETNHIQSTSQTHITVKTVNTESGDLSWSLLDSLRPHWVILYSPNMPFVRKLEVYKSLYPSIGLKVYFMVYDNSVEEQQYLTLLRKEKDSFEKLIHQKSNLSIPIDEDGNIILDAEQAFWQKVDTRIAGGQALQHRVRKVLVDVREFRSSLPMALYSRRMEVIPVTLEIGDYILSDEIAVERKSPSDLSQSLRSGRLYKQCQAMCLHYENPLLLLEFPQINAFRMAFSPFDTEIDTARRLVLLILHFPKLGIIWSASSNATAEIFEDLRRKESNLDIERAQHAGIANEPIDGDCNPTPAVILLKIGNVT